MLRLHLPCFRHQYWIRQMRTNDTRLLVISLVLSLKKLFFLRVHGRAFGLGTSEDNAGWV